MRISRLLVAFLVVLLVPVTVALAYNPNPSLKWRTIKTEHFEVHFHNGGEWTAQQVARIAEEVHGPLTELYDYEPKVPVHFVIKDTDDYANGGAFFYDNKVEIWATNLEFGFRGTTNWLRNVVTHEYTHIISIQASTKMPRWMPALYFQLIGFEKEKRSDVLQGYPNKIVTYPFSGMMMPPWFAEGIAQYQSPYKQYDCWDAHRDMILRSAVMEDKMLTYDQMSFFGKSSLRSEQVYDHGYSLVRYIASEYGPDAIPKIARALKRFTRLSMNGALKEVTGKTGGQLYEDWKQDLARRYAEQTRDILAHVRTGSVIAPEGVPQKDWKDGFVLQGERSSHACPYCGMQFRASGDRAGFMTIAPVYSPDGKKIAFLSNKGSEFAGTSLYVMDSDGKNAKPLASGVVSRPQFSADGVKLIYSKKEKVNKYGATLNDLFVYDITKKKQKKLTHSLRVGDPDFSPDGGRVVCVVNGDGTHRLMVMDSDGSNQRELLVRHHGTQLYNPHFSPDGKTILFGIFEGVTRDIATIPAGGGELDYVLSTSSDERDARWTRAGDGMVFASDRSGIFNIYEMDFESGEVKKHTDVIGGAFMPNVSPDGYTLVYSGYSADGYHVYRVNGLATPVEVLDETAYGQRTAGPFDECTGLRSTAIERRSSGDYAVVTDAVHAESRTDAAPIDGGEATAGALLDSEKYKTTGTPFLLYPRLVIYDGTPRLGFFAGSYEILDKQSFFLGGSYGTNKEFDAFLSFEIRRWFPTLFVDAFVLQERANDRIVVDDPSSPPVQIFDFDLRYDLWQTDIGVKLEFGPQFALTKQHDVSLSWSHAEYSINVDPTLLGKDGRVPQEDAGWKYFIGNEATLQYNFRKIGAAVHADIHPRSGRSVTLRAMRAFDDLFSGGEFAYGFRPLFTRNEFGQYTLDWREYVGLPWLSHSLRLRAFGSVIDENVDDFFWLYLGGRDGIRGYTYYSIGGRKGVIGSVTYRFPIWRRIDKQFLHLHLRDVFGGLFYETANAWNSGYKTTDFKSSAGYELRLSLGSFYAFPTAVSFAGAYSFDPVEFIDPGFGDFPIVLRQERSWSYYFTVGFGFDL